MADNTADSVINAIIRFAWPIFGILAITSGTFLFWPSATALFRLDKLPAWIQDYSGLAFVVSISVLICLVLQAIGKAVYERKLMRQEEEYQEQYKADLLEVLTSLNQEEKAILREFLLSGQDVQNLPFQDPVVLGLRNKQVLFKAAQSAVVYGPRMEFPHQLPLGVKKMIRPEMVDLNEAIALYDSDQEKFQASRPHFRQPRFDW